MLGDCDGHSDVDLRTYLQGSADNPDNSIKCTSSHVNCPKLALVDT
jgi:hypothetical protein